MELYLRENELFNIELFCHLTEWGENLYLYETGLFKSE